MADIVDVENALLAAAVLAVYPNGTGQPSITGAATKLYCGWPTSSVLDVDLAAGGVHVTIFPTQIERNTTRWPSNSWQPQTPANPTLTAALSGRTVTIGGTVAVPQTVMLMIGHQPVIYAVQASDTLNSIAAGLAALVPGATAAGVVVTLPATANATAARIGASGTGIKEVRRQNRQVKFTVWAPTPSLRDRTAQAIDVAMAQIEFLTMPDQTGCRVVYASSLVDDMLQKSLLFRRDLNYWCEYATTVTETEYQITQEQLNTSPLSSGIGATASISTYQ